MDGDARIRALLGETAWLARVARGLGGDAATADDVAQEAWLIAAARAPADRPLRPWLARVVTNVVRMRARADRRRATREEVAEARRATPDELFARVELQRVLAEAVLALAPPYRDVVLLHYVEDRTSTEIAAQLGIADGTVRWRLKTALAQLRAALDHRTQGRREAWMAPVAALAAPRPVGALAGGAT